MVFPLSETLILSKGQIASLVSPLFFHLITVDQGIIFNHHAWQHHFPPTPPFPNS